MTKVALMPSRTNFTATVNACKLCRPMGAAIAFRGIEGCVPFLHGSQGCATYMRRYIISHFNEPIDIASSSLGEKNAIFGGAPNLKLGLKNVAEKYHPTLIGIATTCLTETIGDDVAAILKEFRNDTANPEDLPILINVSSPSYSGSHMEGFHDAMLAAVSQLASEQPPVTGTLNLLPGFISSADLRYLKDLITDFGLQATVLPDISDTLDGPSLRRYPLIPKGGTPLAAIAAMGGAALTIEFGPTLAGRKTAGTFLEERFGVKRHLLGMPVGIRATDRFFLQLGEASGRKTPAKYRNERGRLVDAYVDGHKYLYGKRAVVYGEEDLVVGLTSFLAECGIKPVLCASGGNSGRLQDAITEVVRDVLPEGELPVVRDNVDFHDIENEAAALSPDLLIGHSKGYPLARRLDIPLIRVGFPIHDRIGGQRILHLGYGGALGLFDTIVNTLIGEKQKKSSVGYSYM
ncbi:MAG: nitrogenase component 1 [Thermodesulfobacteriota bacterium]